MDLRARVAATLETAWTEPGFCVPNPTVYPHQWLWDSCFHSLIWLALNRPDRALTEVGCALSSIHDSGFVPHMIYWSEPEAARSLWGRPGVSIITQPPMYGHSIAALIRAGAEPEPEIVERAGRGLTHLLTGRPRTGAGLIPVYHPWETGCDDSPRWDWMRRSDLDITDWRRTKAELVAAIETTADGTPATNPAFSVGSIGFNALVAWNALELASVLDDRTLRAEATELVAIIATRWDDKTGTWVDDWTTTPGRTERSQPASALVRTLDTSLALLVDPRPEGFDQLEDEAIFAAPFGPRGVDTAYAHYDPNSYWRGPAWPQLIYLLARAAQGDSRTSLAQRLADQLTVGAETGGLAEYWNPETGDGRGAKPQSWTGLAIVQADDDHD